MPHQHHHDYKFLNFRVTRRNRAAVFVVLGLLFIIPYFFNNRVSFFEPRVFQLTSLEFWIPFWSWTVWIYVSDYAYPFLVGYQLQSTQNLSIVSLSFLLMSIVTNLIFFFYPVNFPRELFPLSEGDSFMMAWIREVDRPTNCFPSAHVSIVWVSFLGIKREKPQYFWHYLIWAMLIFISTLTTKQHYIVDIIGGLLVAQVCFYIAERVITRGESE